MCGCYYSETVDGTEHVSMPCHEDHDLWCSKVGRGFAETRRREMGDYHRKTFSKVLEMYLKNLGSGTKLFRPELVPTGGTLTPEQAMFDIESKSVYPVECSNPEKLADYLQGKSLMGLLLEELKESRYKRLSADTKSAESAVLIFGEEILADGLISKDMFKSVYGRKPEDSFVEFFNEL